MKNPTPRKPNASGMRNLTTIYRKIFAVTMTALSLSSLFSSITKSFATPTSSICVLTYEREGSQIAKGVLDVYQNYPKASVKTQAVPEDIIRCIARGAEEIVIIAHAVEIQDSKQVRLGYLIPRIDPYQQGNIPDFQIGFFLDHVFETANNLLKNQERTGKRRLTKIRIMVCDPSDVLAAYPSLQALITDHSIQLDTAPTSRFMSMFTDVPVTSFDTAWLAQDIACSELTGGWRTSENTWCKEDSWPGCDRSRTRYCLPL